MKIGYIDVGEEPKRIDIEPDEAGSYLHSMQKLVGGLIEYFEPMYGTKPSLVVNEEGIFKCEPNRAVFATKRMEKQGFLDMMTYSHPVKEGELYTILYGPILAVPLEWDEDGNEVYRDITDEEFNRICKDFSDVDSGIRAVIETLLKGRLECSA